MERNKITYIHCMQCYNSAVDENDAIPPNKHHEIFIKPSGGGHRCSDHDQLSAFLPADAPQHERLAAASNDPG